MTPEDMVTLRFVCEDGSEIVADLTLEQAAALQRGEAVAGYDGELQVRHYSLDDQIAGLRARQDQITERREELKRQYPGIEHGEWDA